MSTVAPIPANGPRTRHALGLPAGSIRALLTLMVVGLICLLLLTSPLESGPIPIPPYLLYLLFLTLGHFFAAHGHSISRAGSGDPSPLYLPGGIVRLIIIAGLVATVAYKYTHDPDDLSAQLTGALAALQEQPLLPVVLLSGFFLGVILHVVVGRQHTPYWFQDVEAWVALIAFIALFVELIIHFVINPTLKTPLIMYNWQGFIAAVVAFYFGARS